MRPVVITLMAYCTLAVVVLAVMIGLNVRGLQAGNELAASLQAEHAAAKQVLNRADSVYFDLEARQRRERGDYTGEQAVRASLEVQDALAVRMKAQAAFRDAGERLDTALAEVAAARMRFLPQVLLLLVHIVGGLVLLPYLRPKI